MSDILIRNEALGTVETFEAWLNGAIEHAERERIDLERVRAINVQRMIDRGTCFVGHALDLPEIPMNWNGKHPCGYCSSARAEMEA